LLRRSLGFRRGKQVMRQLLRKVQAFIRNPSIQLGTELILFVSGVCEICYDFIDTGRSIRLGVHHGVALFGLAQVLGSLPEVVDGLERAFKGWESRGGRPDAEQAT
jgi:hypothetical protein